MSILSKPSLTTSVIYRDLRLLSIRLYFVRPINKIITDPTPYFSHLTTQFRRSTGWLLVVDAIEPQLAQLGYYKRRNGNRGRTRYASSRIHPGCSERSAWRRLRPVSNPRSPCSCIAGTEVLHSIDRSLCLPSGHVSPSSGPAERAIRTMRLVCSESDSITEVLFDLAERFLPVRQQSEQNGAALPPVICPLSGRGSADRRLQPPLRPLRRYPHAGAAG